MNRSITTGLALLLLLTQPLTAREIRTFTNKEGKQIEAELLDLRDRKVRLMVNRRPFDAPLESLSEEDQTLLKECDLKRQGKEDELYYSELIFQDDFEK